MRQSYLVLDKNKQDQRLHNLLGRMIRDGSFNDDDSTTPGRTMRNVRRTPRKRLWLFAPMLPDQ